MFSVVNVVELRTVVDEGIPRIEDRSRGNEIRENRHTYLVKIFQFFSQIRTKFLERKCELIFEGEFRPTNIRKPNNRCRKFISTENNL